MLSRDVILLACIFASFAAVPTVRAENPILTPPITQRPDGSRLVSGRWLRPAWTCKWDELVRLTINTDGQLVLDPPVTDRIRGLMRARRSAVIAVSGSPDLWVISCALDQQPTQLQLLAAREDRPRELDSYRANLVRVRPEMLTIAGEGQLGKRNVAAELRCSYIEGGGVELLITDRSAAAAAGGQSISRQARTLSELLVQSPGTCHRYLLPLLREFAGEQFLAPGAADVYRAFSDIPADAPASAAAMIAIEQMADPDPARRESADAALDALGRPGVVALLRLYPSAREQFSLEQQQRMNEYLARHSIRNADLAAQRARDPWFAFDCLTDPDPRVRAKAKALLAAALGHELSFDSAADPAKERSKLATIEDDLQRSTIER